jgi:hypothetical protein
VNRAGKLVVTLLTAVFLALVGIALAGGHDGHERHRPGHHAVHTVGPP